MYLDSIDAMSKHLFRLSQPSNLLYVQELIGDSPENKMVPEDRSFLVSFDQDHLVCFLPGLLALGAEYMEVSIRIKHMELSERLMKTCMEFYLRSKTGLAPEIVRFVDGIDFENDGGSLHNILRPETIESLFILWRKTHDLQYRKWAYTIFQSFKKYCRLPKKGYASLGNVDDVSTADENLASSNWRDHMESFFLAETMKYFYLIFADDSLIPLDKYVLNTEAHPLAIDLDTSFRVKSKKT
jgi:mannosyl-oligosaccharide alpha-1,2-mannosidase